MPRFTDNWVVDRTMFDYVNGGSCACCGFSHLFNPGGLKGLIDSMSDLETDSAARELNAARTSPWPPDMRDQIWSDRLLLRYRMKKDMGGYKRFFEEVAAATAEAKDGGNDATTNGDAGGDDSDSSDEGKGTDDMKRAMDVLVEFCRTDLGPKELRRIFQLPRSEVGEILKSKYKMCSAYAVVICAVVEQVANLKVTGYGIDARSGSGGTRNGVEGLEHAEEEFERVMNYDKRGPGFCLPISKKDETTNDFVVNDEAVSTFVKRMVSLGGPTLLAREAKVARSLDEDDDEGDADGADEAENEVDESPSVPSFRSDRRVVRLLIARHWADKIIDSYREKHGMTK